MLPSWNLDQFLATMGIAQPAPSVPLYEIVKNPRMHSTGCAWVSLRKERHPRAIRIAQRLLKEGKITAAVLPGDPGEYDSKWPIFFTTNTMSALENCAASKIQEFSGVQLAITGSVGKTTTKYIAENIFGNFGTTLATRLNLNEYKNIVPLTAGITDDIKFLIYELHAPANGFRHMRRIIRPQIAIITNVGISHLERHKTPENLLAVKFSLLKLLRPGGIAIVDYDASLRASEHLRDVENIITVGQSPNADIFFGPVESTLTTSTATIKVFDTPVRVSVPSPAPHSINAAAFVLAAVHAAGFDIHAAAEAMSKAPMPSHRLERWKVEIANGAIELVDDTYNASPTSVRAFLDVFDRYKNATRKILVLGDMLELGKEEISAHEGIMRRANESCADMIITVGNSYKQATRLINNIPVFSFEEANDALPIIENLLRPGDVVALKSSRSTDLIGIVKNILEKYEHSPAGDWSVA